MTRTPEPSGIFYRTMPVATKAVDVEARTVRVVASTAAIDGHGEIVEQDWDFSRFEKNPVVLWNHNRFAEGANAIPLGQAKDYGVVNPDTDRAALEATLVFASAAANPMADNVLQSFSEGTLRMVSVGFRPRDIRFEMIDEREVAVLSNNLLLEISPTPIGSNPEALAKQKVLERAYIERATGRKPPKTDMERELDVRVVAGRITLNGRTPNSPSPERGADNQPTEVDMDPKEMQAALDKTKADLDKATSERDALEAQNAKLAAERDAAVKRADEAETKQIEADVDELIGKKFLPVERDDQIALRRSSPDLWARLTKQRAPLTILERQVAAESPEEKTKRDQADNETENHPGKGSADMINQAAHGG